MTQQTFIAKATNIHQNKYDYSKVIYKNTHTKVEVICPQHGSFFPRPMDHVNKRSGCPNCTGRKRRTTASFVGDATAIHGNQYDYTNTQFSNFDTKVAITCPIHGQFFMTPRAHLLQKQGCKTCGLHKSGLNRRTAQSDFIQNAIDVHGDNYDYTNVVYETSGIKIDIICKQHGLFKQTPNNHLNGQGCPDCAKNNRGGHGAYSPEYFITFPDRRNTPAHLYVAEFVNGKDHFYKIGVTVNTLSERYASKKTKQMCITPIIEHQTTLFDAYTQEQYLLSVLKPYRYYPNTKFGGYTECFKVNEQVRHILNVHFKMYTEQKVDD